MPLYEYKCRSCGKTFEVIQKFADEPLKIHPDCGGEVERLFSAPAFHLKGTGWYATDYAKKSASGGKAEDHKPESKSKPDSGTAETSSSTASGTSSSSSTSSGTESKPAAAESKPAATVSTVSTDK